MENSLGFMNLSKLAFLRFFSGIIIISLILFIPAGTYKYWNAWIFLITVFTPILFMIIYLTLYDPELLKKRLNNRETRKSQRLLIKLSFIPFTIAILIPGLDFRFGWSNMPVWLVWAGVIIFLAGYLLFFLVLRRNSFASRVIEIQEKQKLIDSGIYSVVRHPMYLSNIIIYLSMPLILGSWYAFIPMLLFSFVFYYRVKDEEELLINELEGYPEYVKKVKYRIIPYVW